MTLPHSSPYSLETFQAKFTEQLLHYLPPVTPTAPPVIAAMHYASLNGGKRVRPLLVYETGMALAVNEASLHPAAVAIELIHTYSLIHDDLPAMDDDALRRGRPTCHIAFDEATAILAGDGLQALAFDILSRSNDHLTPTQQLAMIACLAQAAGAIGMVGGQSLDMAATGKSIDLTALLHLQAQKTGALLVATVELAMIAALQVPATIKQALQTFARCLGLAFQIRDDILDIEGAEETLGKAVGTDVALGKNTYPGLVGMLAVKAKLEALHQEAVGALRCLGEAGIPLQKIMDYMIQRES